jgi:hypothetical protein
MPSSGGRAVRLTTGEEDVPQESPEGDLLYFQTGWPSKLSIWRMPVEGGQPMKVLDAVDPSGQWAVSRQGIFYVAAADGGNQFDIRLYEFASGKSTKLITLDREMRHPIVVSPDGRTILWTKVEEAGSDLMLVENFR